MTRELLRPTVSVIVPVFNGRRYLAWSLRNVLRNDDAHLAEVIVVDDGSDDGSGELAATFGALVLNSGGRRCGPARARNVGAGAARGDILLFVDADVVPHLDVVKSILKAFEDPDTAAVFGSYDDAPPHRSFASQYMNLRHHQIHGSPSEDAHTFWAGLGAVRRREFLEVGGFDSQRFQRPSVEDIEIGARLRATGKRIRRLPWIQGTHLKSWSIWEVLKTDVRDRAFPWATLMLEQPGAFGDLNVDAMERVRAGLAVALAGSTVLAAAGSLPFSAALGVLVAVAAANRRITTVFFRRNGGWFAVRALLFHQLYYVYSGASFVWALLRHRSSRRASPSS